MPSTTFNLFRRRPTPEKLDSMDKTIASLRRTLDRAKRLALLEKNEGWPEFQALLDEKIEGIGLEVAVLQHQSNRFMNPEQVNKRALLLERKETFERVRTLVESARDSIASIEAQLMEAQDSRTRYSDQLGA